MNVFFLHENIFHANSKPVIKIVSFINSPPFIGGEFWALMCGEVPQALSFSLHANRENDALSNAFASRDAKAVVRIF